MMRFCRSLTFICVSLLWMLLAAGPGTAQTAAPEQTAASPSHFLASRLDRTREHLQQLAQAVPALPRYFQDVVESFRSAAARNTGTARIGLGIALCLVAGAAVEWAFRRGTAAVRTRRRAAGVRRLSDRLTQFGVAAALDLGAILVFALGAMIALLAQEWPATIQEAAMSFIAAVVWLRLASALLTILLRPKADRDLAAFDLEPRAARFWHRHLAALVGWFALGWAAIVTVRLFGMPRDGQQVLAYLLGIGLVVIVLSIVWRRAPTATEATSQTLAARHTGRSLASLGAVVFWLVWAVGAMPTFWFLTAAVGLPLAIGAARRGARHLLRPVVQADGTPEAPSVLAVFVEQGLRALLIVGAIWLLLWGWGLDVGSLAAQETAATRLLRGSLHGLIILLVADLVWSLLKALADNALAKAQVTVGLDAEETRRRARIRTLLPIGRNVAAIVLVVMAGLMALAALGVEIAPLIASAGVVGVAVGFGAQTVVRDMISGMFYMLDDAFRVGEYIQSGNYKGVVESFSLRSVKLRHQRGPLFTIPFGVLGAVQNMSRDWVIVKDQIGITYDSDVDKAKKLIKQIGLELAKDPDLGPNILQPLKMQGIEQFGDYSINIRMKMMTKPGEQFVIRRKANAMIKKAFDENGIHFAFPTVQLAGGGTADNGAAAAAAQKVLKPAAPPA
jgi:small-conductance mechanosensitive channel